MKRILFVAAVAALSSFSGLATATAHEGPHGPATAPTQPSAGGIVEFVIRAGTGAGPWNTLETVVRVRQGQILRIINADSIPHYLHTPGAPCPHGTGPFGPGEKYDCIITQAADPVRTVLYDHNFGSSSRFYVHATVD